MKEKTDLKTPILAAKEGRKFKATKKYVSFESNVFKSWDEWTTEAVIADWEVGWIKEPLRIELSGYVREELDTDLAYIKQYVPREFIGRQCKILITEIVEGK